MSTVQWVVGRKKALARAIAIQSVQANGLRWEALGQSRRDQLVKDAEALLTSLVSHGVLAQFKHEYRERDDDGWEQLADWSKGT